MNTFLYTNKGSREENQDFVVHGSLPDDSAVFIVADGMGGYSDGAAASMGIQYGRGKLRNIGRTSYRFSRGNHDRKHPIIR